MSIQNREVVNGTQQNAVMAKVLTIVADSFL